MGIIKVLKLTEYSPKLAFLPSREISNYFILVRNSELRHLLVFMLIPFVEKINATILLFNHIYHRYSMEKVTDTRQFMFHSYLPGLFFSSLPNHSVNGLFGQKPHKCSHIDHVPPNTVPCKRKLLNCLCHGASWKFLEQSLCTRTSIHPFIESFVCPKMLMGMVLSARTALVSQYLLTAKSLVNIISKSDSKNSLEIPNMTSLMTK